MATADIAHHNVYKPSQLLSNKISFQSPTKRTNGYYHTHQSQYQHESDNADSDDLNDMESQSPTHSHHPLPHTEPYHPRTFPNNHSVRHRLRKPIKSLQPFNRTTKTSHNKPRYYKRNFKKFQPQHKHKKKPLKQDNKLRIITGIALFIIAISIYYLYSDLLTFSSLKNNHHSIISFVDKYPILSPLIFIVFECIVVGLTIPGATVLSMASGLFFNQPFASFYAWFGCASGAFMCYIFVRFICADCFKSQLNKHGDWFKTFEHGLKKNELLYLIYVRYVIIIPFWFVNVAAALFGCKISNFILSTLIATIPGALLLTTAGRGLAHAFTSYHQEITAFDLFKEILWTKDMLFCVSLLLFCLSMPFLLKKYAANCVDIFNKESSKTQREYNKNDFIDSDDDERDKNK